MTTLDIFGIFLLTPFIVAVWIGMCFVVIQFIQWLKDEVL